MPTLLEDLHALLSVQAIDTRIERAKSALNTLDSGADIAAVYNAGKAEFDALRAAMVKAQSEQKDAELKLQSLEEKRTEVEKTLYSGGITASRELDSLNMQLDMLERQRGDFAPKQLHHVLLLLASHCQSSQLQLAGLLHHRP